MTAQLSSAETVEVLDKAEERDSIIEKAHDGRGHGPVWEIPGKGRTT